MEGLTAKALSTRVNINVDPAPGSQPTVYGYGPRPGDPLGAEDTPSLSGELGLTERALEFLLDSLLELESKVDAMLLPQPEHNGITMGIVQPPLPPALDQMRAQRHQIYAAVERVRALTGRIAA